MPFSIPGSEQYKLVVVKDSLVGDDYYTMSAQGVVHVQTNKGKSGAVMDLGVWMQHATLYKVLARSRLFRLWRASKAMFYWKAAMRKEHYAKKKNDLFRRLYFSKPAFCVPLIKVFSQLYWLYALRYNEIKQFCACIVV